jgi:hypothetical protein
MKLIRLKGYDSLGGNRLDVANRSNVIGCARFSVRENCQA